VWICGFLFLNDGARNSDDADLAFEEGGCRVSSSFFHILSPWLPEGQADDGVSYSHTLSSDRGDGRAEKHRSVTEFYCSTKKLYFKKRPWDFHSMTFQFPFYSKYSCTPLRSGLWNLLFHFSFSLNTDTVVLKGKQALTISIYSTEVIVFLF